MLKRNCIVKYVDTFGIEHSVRVEAESLFEAAIRGLQRLHSSFKADVWDRISISVEVYAEPTTYGVMIQKLKPWIRSEERHPQKEATTERLRLSPRSRAEEPQVGSRPSSARSFNHSSGQPVAPVQLQGYSEKRERVQTRRATNINDPMKRNL